MFRFTIRDVLWLTVVVGLTCASLVTAKKCRSLERELEERKRNVPADLLHCSLTTQALAEELQRLSGKRVSYGYVADGSEPSGYKWHFEYSEK
jgi:hypothetical protein